MTERAVLSTTRVIGVGNDWRGDDAVGLQAARRLRRGLGASVEVIEAVGDGSALIDLMEGADSVIFIDAVTGGGQPGKTVRLDLSRESLWGSVVPSSTHALGLAGAIDLARILGRLPKHVVLYGITIESVECGAPLSESVCAGLDLIIELVREEIERV